MDFSPSGPSLKSSPLDDAQRHRLPGSLCVRALWLIGLLGFSASASATPLASERSAIRATLSDLPLTFEANQGQSDARVDFLARGQGYRLFLTPTEAVFALSGSGISNERARKGQQSDAPQTSRAVMRMQLVGSAPDAQVRGLDELPGKVNYFRGKESAAWQKNVPTYRKVRYTAVYPGIDLIYYGQPRQLEYDFIVAPGADPNDIKLAFAGVENSTIDSRGDLVLKTHVGPLHFQKPIIYQLEAGRKQIVEGEYVHRSAREIGFRVSSYDRTRPLIIDPVLIYSTHLGGSADDWGEAIAVDDTGAAYVTGYTESTDFPTVNALQPIHRGFNRDVFVAKINPEGTALAYATYLGGSEDDTARAITVDSTGAAYITGFTSSVDFPSERALPSDFCESEDDFRTYDAFVAKVAADGSRLIYSTCLGGEREDFGQAIAVDDSDAAYVGGRTFSCDFPTVNAFIAACHVQDSGNLEAFLAKFTPDGSLDYSTYFGGDGTQVAGIAVHSSGALYVTGATGEPDFPNQDLQPGSGFVTKFAPGGKSLVYATQVGGVPNGIAVDETGAAYVIGTTHSAEFPTVNAVQPVYGGSGDAFVVKLAPDGGSSIYSTYLGGSGVEEGSGIAADADGAAYMTGRTFSADFLTGSAGPDSGYDAYVIKLTADGRGLAYGTRLHGSMNDIGTAIAVDLDGAAYVTGSTTSVDFPTKQPLQEPGSSGIITDAFVTKLTATASPQAPNVVRPESEDFPTELRDIQFGEAVAIRDGMAFVGIPKAADGGHVAVLNLTASGWTRVGTIKLPESVARNIGETSFGRVLNWRDGVLMVGGEKAAYYFSGRNGVWTFRSVIAPLHRYLGSVFPAAMRYQAGETQITSSPHLPRFVGTLLASELAAPCCPSRVHIFYKYPTGSGFFYAGFVQPSDSQAGDNFGADLSMTSRAFVVGSPRGSRDRIAGLPAYDQTGAAYIFRQGADGQWRQGQKLLPSEPAPGFGTSVAINRDMIVVGAPKTDIQGAAYVFVPGATRYVQSLKLRPQPNELFQYQNFGYRAAMFGPHVAIAAARPYEVDGTFPSGLVSIYRRDGTSLLPRGIAQGHVVAASMGLANNWLLLGVPYERSCPSSGCVGSAHLYDVNSLTQ